MLNQPTQFSTKNPGVNSVDGRQRGREVGDEEDS